MAVDWKKVSRTAAEILHVEVDDKWNKSIDNLKKRYSRYRTWLMNQKSSSRALNNGDEIVLKRHELIQIVDTPSPKIRKVNPLYNLERKQLMSRTEALWESVEEFAAANQETVLRVIALLIVLRIKDNFPCIQIRPFVHKLLGHSWEFIYSNNDCGLKIGMSLA